MVIRNSGPVVPNFYKGWGLLSVSSPEHSCPSADGFAEMPVASTELGFALNGTLHARSLSNARCPVRRTERVRQMVSGPLESTDLQQRAEGGWKLVAIEWEREVESADDELLTEIPFGLRIAPGTQGLEQNPAEREILLQLMELIVQEGSYAHIADEINRRGLRTRQGEKWTPVSVFEMLPRLIEVGPQLFESAEWQKRRQHIAQER
jgi:Recombinase